MPDTRLLLAATLLLAACQDKPEQTGDSENSIAGTSANNSSASSQHPQTDVKNTAAPTASKEAAPAGRAIPAAFHGRWGMVPADCGPDAAIAKGLVTIDGAKLRFYESVGKPAVISSPAPDRIEGRFTFSGEGMEWSKDMALTLKDDDTLVRTEKDPVARYSYTRCKT